MTATATGANACQPAPEVRIPHPTPAPSPVTRVSARSLRHEVRGVRGLGVSGAGSETSFHIRGIVYMATSTTTAIPAAIPTAMPAASPNPIPNPIPNPSPAAIPAPIPAARLYAAVEWRSNFRHCGAIRIGSSFWARASGYSWRTIGALVGTSGEAARQRYGSRRAA